MAIICADYVVVGSGITGATIARQLADSGRDVVVVDRRGHLGGNVHDFEHPSGIRVHTFGPHYFRTNSEALWSYINRFGAFYPYRAQVKSWVSGSYETWPLTRSYIVSVAGLDWKPEHVGQSENFEQACLARMPRVVYDRFVCGYTQKQWGISPSLLEKELAARFDVREDDEPDFSRHSRQGIPREGYAALMRRMMDGIPHLLEFDYLRHRESVRHKKKLIFTGPIDEFFGFDLGKLKYRAQRRVHQFLAEKSFAQPAGQVNNPGLENGAFIRTLEWKHMMPVQDSMSIQGTVLTREYPFTPDDPNEYEYPFPDSSNRELYARYRERASHLSDTLICGRLGEYRYLDMDQAMARALMWSQHLLTGSDRRPARGFQ
jgi:UDP-galactopyranose mutase